MPLQRKMTAVYRLSLTDAAKAGSDLASAAAGRSIGVQANTILTLRSIAGGGFELRVNQVVNIGILLGSVNVSTVQFSSTGKVTNVDAKWLGMSVSDKATKQLSKALEDLFGNTSSILANRLDQSIISNAANAILDVARNNTTGFCADITVTTKK
jgi:hypothetical protein